MDTKYKLPNIWSHSVHAYRPNALVLCILNLYKTNFILYKWNNVVLGHIWTYCLG